MLQQLFFESNLNLDAQGIKKCSVFVLYIFS